jgi:cytosine/adenosine deaminase-related metal-dependent hydrolase
MAETGTRAEPSVADVLRAARDLYEQAPSHALPWDDPEPGRNCVLSATDAAASALGMGDAGCSADLVLRHVVGTELVQWNAYSSTETVLDAFNRAIREAESDG